MIMIMNKKRNKNEKKCKKDKKLMKTMNLKDKRYV